MMTNSPCKDCEDRTVKCHSECIKYDEFMKIHKSEKDIIDKNRQLSLACWDVKIHGIIRMMKRKK